ncbi:MAG TPA: J domain-containing protein [Rectinemataceae bacterium]
MDQIFERLERLVRAWTNLGGDASPRSSRSFGDPDLDAAMAELDDFLDTSKTETEKRQAREEEEARAQAKRDRERASPGGGYGSGDYAGGAYRDPSFEQRQAVEQAYRYLGLSPNAPFAEVKAAYKRLLFKHHPDRNSSSPAEAKRATETSAKINAAYQVIEAYEDAKAGR